ncbi:hypothetical protein BOTBODRAFT_173417 [Botryobasidium botryosum FD-172 SS1]|uniref:Uncharacterized protein n=1 Tax=Botryobasidium botryosum (strain FD-172 SS1) TaxID=930990 RepID=A0A067MX61_BOTB1|nr:hypothetical protein BOTBODRAFT_173417 [Botryobasidium botryosum FD-172 SS1]
MLYVSGVPHLKRDDVDSMAYIAPASNGGSQLDQSAGLGEPLNVIISALSSPSVLTTEGIEDYARSFNFSTECFDLHIGNKQTANLGDGQGYQDEIAVMRQDFGNPDLGTCLESLAGGNHFRFWRQNTTGAYFLAASKEEWAGDNHDIIPDGYNIGRDELVGAAAGDTNYNGVNYTTTVDWIAGLLAPGSNGINHGISQDGMVALLTVTIVNTTFCSSEVHK